MGVCSNVSAELQALRFGLLLANKAKLKLDKCSTGGLQIFIFLFALGWDEELLLHCNRLVRQLTIASNSLQSSKCSFLLRLLRLVRLLQLLLLGLEEERLLLLRQARMDLQKRKLKLEWFVLTYWKLALGQLARKAMFTCNPTWEALGRPSTPISTATQNHREGKSRYKGLRLTGIKKGNSILIQGNRQRETLGRKLNRELSLFYHWVRRKSWWRSKGIYLAQKPRLWKRGGVQYPILFDSERSVSSSWKRAVKLSSRLASLARASGWSEVCASHWSSTRTSSMICLDRGRKKEAHTPSLGSRRLVILKLACEYPLSLREP